MDMNNAELIELSSDDEAGIAMEAAARKRVGAKRRARKAAAREAAANHIVAIRGPNKKGRHSYDKFCVFPNRVALNSSQVNYLKYVSKEMPTIPSYICTIQEANSDDTKGKMYFSKKYILANISKHLKLPAEVTIYMRNKRRAEVKLIMSKGKGKGAQITTNWNKVVEMTNMHIGDIFMFWFRYSSINGLKLIVKKVM